MINLLPPKERQKLVLKKQERLVLVLGIIIEVSLFCFILMLLAIKFYILSESDYQTISFDQEAESSKTPEFIKLSEDIQKYNNLLGQIDLFYDQEIYFGDVFDTIFSVQKPESIYFTNFSFNRQADGNVKVDISGTGDTRDNLLIFKKNLEEDIRIINPSFSADSWINSKNVKFSLSLEIIKNENGQ